MVLLYSTDQKLDKHYSEDRHALLLATLFLGEAYIMTLVAMQY